MLFEQARELNWFKRAYRACPSDLRNIEYNEIKIWIRVFWKALVSGAVISLKIVLIFSAAYSQTKQGSQYRDSLQKDQNRSLALDV